jgi:hypothetical protein
MTATEIRAIETHYRGYRFRSRLEARWAVFFDEMGLEWVYEHEGYEIEGVGPYLPDFEIGEAIVEIKPLSIGRDIKQWQAAQQKCREFTSATDRFAMVLVGTPGDHAVIAWHRDFPKGADVDFAECAKCSGLVCKCYTVAGSERGALIGHVHLCHQQGCNGRQVSQFGHRISGALSKAKSARFEHGETPR